MQSRSLAPRLAANRYKPKRHEELKVIVANYKIFESDGLGEDKTCNQQLVF